MNGIISALQGRLSRDGEFKYTSAGVPMLVLNLAVTDDKRAEDGPTEWVRVTLWQDLAEQLQDQLPKSSEVYVEGRLKLRTWEKQDGTRGAGVEVSAWKCEPLGRIGRRAPRRQDAGGETPRHRETPEQPPRMPAMAGAVGYREHTDDDGDLPF